MTHVRPPSRPNGIVQEIGRTLVTALAQDLRLNCSNVIEALRQKNPYEYLRIMLSVAPKELEEIEPGLAELSDSELATMLATVRALIAAQGDPPPPTKRGGARDRPPLTAERLRELLDYAPETGLFHWRKARGSTLAGRQAGTRGPYGYRVIGVDGGSYLAHRLAWLHVHGEHPASGIDHANGDRSDNRIANLRPCSQRENSWNTRGRAASGFKGVYRADSREPRWYSMISVNGEIVRLGTFDTKEEAAAAAYDAAARRHHGEFARTNDGQ
jgi:hypothetical protein